MRRKMLGERRRNCGSGDRPTVFHVGNGNGRRREAPERFRFLFCVLCISIALLIPFSSSTGPDMCLPRCWKNETSDVQFKDGDYMKKIVAETECKDWCFSNETCVGAYWGFSPALKLVGCWLQMSSKAASESLTNATHWSLSDCTDDCLPYCWKEKWTHVQVMGGVLQHDIDTENECKVACATDQGCNGADWNTTDKTCWLLFMSPMEHIADPDPVHHWEIQRNLSTTCQQESKAAVPQAESKAAVPEAESKAAVPEAESKAAVPEAEAGAVLSTTETAETVKTAETAETPETPETAETVEIPEAAENLENAENAENVTDTTTLPETATNETEISSTENATESTTLDFDVIVFGTTTPAAINETRIPVAAAAVVGRKSRPRPRGRGGGGVGYSHARRGHVSRMDVDCECPDYMIGIIGLGATMAVLVLIIIGLLAFITNRLHEQEAEAAGNPRGNTGDQYKTSSAALSVSASASAASFSLG